MDRGEWLKARKAGIGGSEMAAVLGVSPWEGPADVWARKKGLVAEREDNLRFKIGRYFEAPIAQLYAEQEGVTLLKVDGIYQHPTAPLVGTPDRLIAGKERGLEIKTADPATIHAWGDPGTDQIPIHYATQVAVYMSLTGFPEWDVAVLFGTSDFRVYRLFRDIELENIIIEKATEFWNRYVVGNEEPAPDESKAYSNYILKKYPSNLLPLAEATEEQAAVIGRYIELSNELKEAERRTELLKNILKGQIGENEGLQSPFGKVLWKKTKDIDVIDWEALALMQLARFNEEERTEYIKRFTTTKPGVRKFNVYPSKLPARGDAE